MEDKEDYLWFSFPLKYEDYLVAENMDAFLVGLLLLAMKRGEDLEVKGIISEKLYYSLKHYLINAINLANPELKKIKIIATGFYSDNINISRSVGTGVSCGVDSFATIYDHLNSSEQFRIGFFTFFNAGSHGQFGGEISRRIYQERLRLVKPFADEYGLDIITVDSNINEILMMDHQQTHTIRDIACVLNLQKLFRYYYYASSYRFDHFNISVNMAEYEGLLLNGLSTESTSFISGASQYTRVERTELITHYEPTYRYLNVCTANIKTGRTENCSECTKCLRTQLTLDLLGKLHLYYKVFDINKYKSKKNLYIGYILANKNKDAFCKEIYDLIRIKRFRISIESYLFSTLFYFKKIIKKILSWYLK
jgi:hypothetical protein